MRNDTLNIAYFGKDKLAAAALKQTFIDAGAHISEYKGIRSDLIILGDGPNTVHEMEIYKNIILDQNKAINGILGIGLGFKVIIEAYGGTVKRLDEPNKSRYIYHDGTYFFKGIRDAGINRVNLDNSPNSGYLAIDNFFSSGLSLETIARDDDGNIMAVKNKDTCKNYFGIQTLPLSNSELVENIVNFFFENSIRQIRKSYGDMNN